MNEEVFFYFTGFQSVFFIRALELKIMVVYRYSVSSIFGCFVLKKIRNGSLQVVICLLYTSPSPRDKRQSRMPSSA